MGKPGEGDASSPHTEFIGMWREPPELNHLSKARKRDYSLSSGERKGNSPNSYCVIGCSRCSMRVVGRNRAFCKGLGELEKSCG